MRGGAKGDGGASAAGGTAKQRRTAEALNQCQKDTRCPRGYRHPGLCRLAGTGGKGDAPPDAPPEHCQKHPLCLRGHRHPGLCRLAPQPSSASYAAAYTSPPPTLKDRSSGARPQHTLRGRRP